MNYKEQLYKELAELRRDAGAIINMAPAEAVEAIDRNYKLKSRILKLGRAFLNKGGGCSSCNDKYNDILIELFFMKEEKVKLPDYEIRRGAILRDTRDSKKNATAANLTNELAEYHLAKSPGYIKYFTRVPADVDERVEAMRKKLEAEGEKFVAVHVSEENANKAADEIKSVATQQAKEIKDKAKAEAEKIIEDAKREAKDIIDGAELNANDIITRANANAEFITAKANGDADLKKEEEKAAPKPRAKRTVKPKE